MSARALMDGVRELLFPKGYTCLLCGREAEVGEDGVCAECRKTLKRVRNYRKLSLVGAVPAAFWYEGAARNAMHRFKYNGAARLADYFMGYVSVPEPERFDCIVPVPMHPLKRYFRRYSPAELLAEVLSEKTGLPVEKDLLVRTRLTASQTKKSRLERTQVLSRVYAARPGIAGRNVLIVDDVVTTGSTLLACASVCLQAGAASVGAACACDTPETKK